MTTLTRQKTKDPFGILTPRGEEILKTIHFYRYMTALDVSRLPNFPSTLRYVRGLLTALSGDGDGLPNQYLCRFSLPRRTPGTMVKVYTLGSKGREFLANEIGLSADWYFRPDKVKHLSFGHLMHQLTLTRFLVAAHAWCAKHPDYRIEKLRISYELAATPARVTLAGERKTETLSVVPDAWLLVEELSKGKHSRWLPVLLEIDRGTEYQQKFKQHIRSRIEFISSGAYQKLFETEAVMIAYATTGETDSYRETRRKTMCTWTQEVLAEQEMEEWATIFRFCSFSYAEIYTTSLYEAPLWYRPDTPKPVTLFPQ